MDFFLGLYDVHIATPTAESVGFAHIDGVNKVGAMKLKKLILEAIKESQPNANIGEGSENRPAKK